MASEHIITNHKLALSILENSIISNENSDVTQNVFFQNKDSNIDIDNIISNYKLNNEKKEFMENNNFPYLLKNIYSILGDPKREFVYKHFSFFSLDNIEKRQTIYKKDGQSKFIDIGLSYQGLGWVFVLTLNISNGKLFLRIDGGSNGYDRDNNYKKFINIKSSDITNDKMYTFEAFLTYIDKKELSEKIIRLED